MQRPHAITPVTIAMCVTNFLGFFLVNWTTAPKHHPLFLFVIFSVMIVTGYVVLWYFWQGIGWARWTVQITSLFALWNLWQLRRPVPGIYGSAVRTPMVLAEGLIAVFLLYYLNTSPVRNWFAGPKTSDKAELATQ
jgi:hypothetical protein